MVRNFADTYLVNVKKGKMFIECYSSFCSFMSQFKKRREELSSKLFKLFNSTVFENKVNNLSIVF